MKKFLDNIIRSDKSFFQFIRFIFIYLLLLYVVPITFYQVVILFFPSLTTPQIGKYSVYFILFVSFIAFFLYQKIVFRAQKLPVTIGLIKYLIAISLLSVISAVVNGSILGSCADEISNINDLLKCQQYPHIIYLQSFFIVNLLITFVIFKYFVFKKITLKNPDKIP